MKETEAQGFGEMRRAQQLLGDKARTLLAEYGYKSVAASGFEAPGVVVCHTDDADIHSGRKFLQQGMQIAAGVPLQCDEPEDYRTFRVGLFGLDKLTDIDRTLQRLESALQAVAKD